MSIDREREGHEGVLPGCLVLERCGRRMRQCDCYNLATSTSLIKHSSKKGPKKKRKHQTCFSYHVRVAVFPTTHSLPVFTFALTDFALCILNMFICTVNLHCGSQAFLNVWTWLKYFKINYNHYSKSCVELFERSEVQMIDTCLYKYKIYLEYF